MMKKDSYSRLQLILDRHSSCHIVDVGFDYL